MGGRPFCIGWRSSIRVPDPLRQVPQRGRAPPRGFPGPPLPRSTPSRRFATVRTVHVFGLLGASEGLGVVAIDLTVAGDEWLFGWDFTPGIVSVWADDGGRAIVWQRAGAGVRRSQARFHRWILRRAWRMRHGGALVEEGPGGTRDLLPGNGWYRRRALSALGADGRALRRAIIQGAAAVGPGSGTCANARRVLRGRRGRAVPDADRAGLLSRPGLRRSPPAAIRPGDDRALADARAHLPGRGARQRGLAASARGAGGRRRGDADRRPLRA